MKYYLYIVYRLVLKLISIFRSTPKRIHSGEYYPTGSLIISAYDEEDVIKDKNSIDFSEDIVMRYSENVVILRKYEGRCGKVACLNKVVPIVNGELIIFSEANAGVVKLKTFIFRDVL